ncbi:MAG: flavodoxin family protein [Dehalococcoidia bacterium]|nr:flavodoxin family protein [Dehalococcoidia bacterium]
MYVLALNGSPRKNSTTAKLLKKALEGAASQGAETEFIQLNQLSMKGCQGCFGCKKRGGKSYGKCIQRDDMTLLYEKIEQADAFFLGSPIYFGTITAPAKAFVERLYPYLNYRDLSSNFPKKINTGLIYTMGADEQQLELLFNQHIQFNHMTFLLLFGSAETLLSTDTFHVKDYSKIVADALEVFVDKKLKHQQEVFPKDCEKAFDMGVRFAKESENKNRR